MYLNETMTEKQERQKCMSWHIFRTSIYFKIPALSSNECYIIIDFYTLITYTFCITYTYNYQKQPLEVSCKVKSCINFAKFTGKHLCQSLFFNKVAGLRPAILLKKRLWHKCFLWLFKKFQRISFFAKHRWAASSNLACTDYLFIYWFL